MPRRLTNLLLVALVVALVALAAAPACSKKKADDDKGSESASKRATTTTSAPLPTLQWTIDATTLNANGTKAPGDDVLAQVTATLDAYLAEAVVRPLHTGTPAGDLSAVFTASALERLASDAAAKATLLDEGLPPASSAIQASTATVALSTVAGADEVTAVVGARVDLALHAVGPTVDVDIKRQGEIVLVQEGGGWRIDSFMLHVTRDSRDAVTTTTAAP